MYQETKVCSTCSQPKTLDSFSKKKSAKDGLHPICKSCTKSYKKQYYITNLKTIQEKRIVYNQENVEKRKERDNEYYIKNRDKHIETSKQFRKNNPNYMKQYRKDNAEKIAIDKKAYKANKLKTDINYKITEYYRARVRLALKNNQKTGSTLDLIGCTIEELKNYIQPLFKLNMSWDNYGKNGWHIVHLTYPTQNNSVNVFIILIYNRYGGMKT
jgi:hypothetical protein